MPIHLLLAATLAVSDTVRPTCDLACEQRTAAVLLEHGELTAAVARLREARQRFREDVTLTLLLARAYSLEGNLYWAERTLREGLQHHPEDSQLRSWHACVLLRQGDTELAGTALGPAPGPGPGRSRWGILEALRLEAEGDRPAAAAALAAVSPSEGLFAEDRVPWLELQRRLNPAWVDPLRGTVELAAGRTSNALAGAPTDPGTSGGASELADLDLHLRLVPPAGGSLRPTLDLDVTGHAFAARTYRELGTLLGALRLGASYPTAGGRTILGYRAERLLINQEDRGYSEADRLELEAETRGGTVVFGGIGRRSYRDHRRTRLEADAGLGLPVSRRGGSQLLLGATVRTADATSPAYDQRGASLAVAGRWPLGRGYAARLAVTATYDDYPHSGGTEGLAVFGSNERRCDLLGRLRLTLSGPTWRGVAPGIEWEVSRRRSTLDDRPGADYSFREMRFAVVARWRLESQLWMPPTAAPEGHVPLHWGGDSGAGDTGESIIELLRQDEELRRSSSCVVR